MLLPLVWAYSIYLVIKTPYFKWFVIINILVLLLSWISFQFYSKTLFGHDEYGLGPNVSNAIVALIQIIVAYIFQCISKRSIEIRYRKPDCDYVNIKQNLLD